MEELQLGCYSGRVRLHTPTLVEYDGRGRCGEIRWHPPLHTAFCKTETNTWAARIGWTVETGGDSIVIRRRKQ